jgi:hypothetical protein
MMMKIVFMIHPADRIDNAINAHGYADMKHYASLIRRKTAVLEVSSIVLSYIGDRNNGNWATLAEIYRINNIRHATRDDFPEADPDGRNEVEEYNHYTYEEIPRNEISWARHFERREWANARNWVQTQPFTEEDLGDAQRRFEEAVQHAQNDSSEIRKERLKNAPGKPELFFTTTAIFRRNPDVVAEVLERAKGFCENKKCGKPAPFLRASDNSPYLEVHHKIPLAQGGDDTVENAIALCPNCHREAHFGRFRSIP